VASSKPPKPKTPTRSPREPRETRVTTNPTIKIQELSARVTEMETYVASLTRDSYDAILGVDRDGTIRSWNRGAWVIFGWEPEEVVGQNYKKIFPAESDAEGEFAKMLRLLEKRGYANDEEAVRATKDGRRVLVSVTRTALRNAAGEFIGFSAIMRDITERKKMEQRLIHGERMSALGELAAILAHEIKNPLNSMVINLEVLKGHLAGIEPTAREKSEKYMRVLTDEMQRLNKVIRGFLDFAKPVSLTFGDANMNAVLRDLVDLVEAQARKNKVTIALEFDPDLPTISGDASQLKQALLNLVLNALHAMPDGGTLTLSTTTLPNRFARATVTDTGPGIPPESLSKVFDLFFTTKIDGSGLGLPTVQRIVESHGGRIDVQSVVLEGTSFHLTFPGA
jgi:PAS domain S-box-containing protein